MANRRSPDPVNPADTARRPPGPRKSSPAMEPRAQVSAEARHALIAQAAYLRAERRGFVPGHETEDWLAAEAEVDALLRAGQSAPQ
ncbi:MAG: DUF2934 domain-containing protein [Gammaproteobacteria bacterium]|nr:DUF2934 domain-containing protein [Gammaproteobacteria bacterium]MBV9725422.1 DUF2934 domain-containing protein [Gammaproteobacteria bacterium]